MKNQPPLRPLNQTEQAFLHELIREYDETIRKVAYSYLGQELRCEFEDVVQDVYEMICRQIDDFKGGANPEPLIVTITMRRVWTVRRDHKQLYEIPAHYPVSDGFEVGLEEILPLSTPKADLRILTSIYEHKESIEELAADTGIKPATLRQQLKRARDRLRKNLEKTKE